MALETSQHPHTDETLSLSRLLINILHPHSHPHSVETLNAAVYTLGGLLRHNRVAAHRFFDRDDGWRQFLLHHHHWKESAPKILARYVNLIEDVFEDHHHHHHLQEPQQITDSQVIINAQKSHLDNVNSHSNPDSNLPSTVDFWKNVQADVCSSLLSSPSTLFSLPPSLEEQMRKAFKCN